MVKLYCYQVQNL